MVACNNFQAWMYLSQVIIYLKKVETCSCFPPSLNPYRIQTSCDTEQGSNANEYVANTVWKTNNRNKEEETNITKTLDSKLRTRERERERRRCVSWWGLPLKQLSSSYFFYLSFSAPFPFFLSALHVIDDFSGLERSFHLFLWALKLFLTKSGWERDVGSTGNERERKNDPRPDLTPDSLITFFHFTSKKEKQREREQDGKQYTSLSNQAKLGSL